MGYEEAEAGWEFESAAVGGPDKGDEESGAGLRGKEGGGLGVNAVQKLGGGVSRSGEEEFVEGDEAYGAARGSLPGEADQPLACVVSVSNAAAWFWRWRRSAGRAANERFGECAHAAAESGESGLSWPAASLAGFALESGYQAAVLGFHVDEGGHDGLDAQLVDVAAEDAGEKRGGDPVEDLLPEVADGRSWRRTRRCRGRRRGARGRG